MTHLRTSRIWIKSPLRRCPSPSSSARRARRRCTGVPSRRPRIAASASIQRVAPAFPLKVSKNRYLVDRRNRPFLVIGDSPQAMIGGLSMRDAAAYIANRKAAGFNALWVNLLCTTYTGCRSDGKTFDGIAPFNNSVDLASRTLDISRAPTQWSTRRTGIVVFLDPIETGGWLKVPGRTARPKPSPTAGTSDGDSRMTPTSSG